ncbi:VOC family protein [Salinibacterium sp. SWN1162]|uniref:VOC family protein n=1 Tax=Salinibacterium sp. SWN1162 TaxID=2792053 RepID=UPI0018CEB584|nr:VOC family protein [Salinibacterium sp. SWN1162]MBH0009432.1 VOC family protein [Salinibacterium sp. SWN1162]
MRLSSAVTFVSDLDRSVAFYCELLQVTCSLRSESAALLVGPDNYELYLRGKHAQPSRVLGSVGIQYLIWSADSMDELQRCEDVLRRESTHVRRERLDDYDVVEGRDPDHLAIMVVFPGPDESVRHSIIPRIYSW